MSQKTVFRWHVIQEQFRTGLAAYAPGAGLKKTEFFIGKWPFFI